MLVGANLKIIASAAILAQATFHTSNDQTNLTFGLSLGWEIRALNSSLNADTLLVFSGCLNKVTS
jgi:hypothetical protein